MVTRAFELSGKVALVVGGATALGRAEELGPLVVFLASPLSDHINGETIVIDGGGMAAGQAPTGLAPVIPL